MRLKQLEECVLMMMLAAAACSNNTDADSPQPQLSEDPAGGGSSGFEDINDDGRAEIDVDIDMDIDTDVDGDTDTDVDADVDSDVDADSDIYSFDDGDNPCSGPNPPDTCSLVPTGPSDGDTDADSDGDTDADGDADYFDTAYEPDTDTSTSSDDSDTGESEDAGEPDAADPEAPESYSANPFVMTAHDPFSTFATDVDTASYDIFRQLVNQGSLPDARSVRLEEYVNFFRYDYPAPEPGSEHPFLIDLAAASSSANPESLVLRVGIQAERLDESDIKPVNMVFLVDVSGSMGSSDKLPLVKRVLTQTLTVLNPTDTVAIVTYSDEAAVRLEPTPVSESEAIVPVIDALSASGSTAGAQGIQMAYEQAEAAFIPDGVNHVMLCTDGDFNVGISDTEELVALIEEKRESGITLTALGFGVGLNDEMMEEVTNAGNGVYGVITSEEQADRYVEDRMLANVYYVAKDMKIQVEMNPEKVLAYRLLGYENRAIADQDFRDDRVDAGEIGTGHQVTALYELILAGGSVPEVRGAPDVEDGPPSEEAREISADDLVLVKVRYKKRDASEEDSAAEVSSTLNEDHVTEAVGDMNLDFQWAVAVARFAEILKHSPHVDISALDDIENTVAAEEWLDPDRAELAELLGLARPMIGGESLAH